MVKQAVSDAVKQARDLARQAGMEVLKVPGEVISQGAKSVGLEGGFTGTSGATSKITTQSSDQGAVDQQLVAARARMKSFASKQSQEWKEAEVQVQVQDQKRVQQIVETQLGHAAEEPDFANPPAGEAGVSSGKQGEKKGGLMGALSGMFKGRKSRRMGAVGQVKKDASGEFGKSHQ